MIVPAFALDRLAYNRADVDPAFLDPVPDFELGFFLARDHVLFALRFWQREIEVWTGDTRPVELGEQIGLSRIGVGQAHRVTAATVERVLEMQNLGAAFAMTRGHVLANLPIHRR